jgi:hypothetical protein
MTRLFRHALPCIALLSMTACVYLGVQDFDLIDMDDQPYVVENEMVRDGLTTRGVLWAFTAFE